MGNDIIARGFHIASGERHVHIVYVNVFFCLLIKKKSDDQVIVKNLVC